MTLTLDPTLAAAQNSQSRHPLIEIISSEFAADIPFDGQFLTSETTNESGPNLIRHSTGRLCLIYKYSTNQIKYVYTDTERTTFSFVTLTIAGGHTLQEAALCELSNGSIGILYRTSSGTSHYLKYKTITVTGTAIAAGDIATYAGSPTITGPAVIRLANGTYLAVYVRLTGTDYTFYKRTSADFITWSAASALSVGGLVLTSEIANPYLQQITTGDIFLWFDYANGENFSNIFYSLSADNGATWGNAVQVTSYADASAKANHPISAQKIAGQLYLIFNEQVSALRMDSGDLGWCYEGNSAAADLSFDTANRKLYATSIWTYSGPKVFQCVVEIDVDTWTVSACWSTSTVPSFSAIYNGGSQNNHGEQYLIPVHTNGTDMSQASIGLLNADADTITNYVFGNRADYGLTQNVEHDMTGILYATWVDFNTRRLYLLSRRGYATDFYISVGYLDLTEPGPIYHCTKIVNDAWFDDAGVWGIAGWGFSVYPGQDLIIVWGQSTLGKAGLRIFEISTGATYKFYHVDSIPAFPYHGMDHCILTGNKVYGGFPYESLYGQQDKRGLCEIDLVTDTVTFHRPTWASVDSYNLEQICVMTDGRLLIGTDGYGITIFNPSTEIWTLFNNTTLPGMEPYSSPALTYCAVLYDESAGMIYGGTPSNIGFSWSGVIAFSEFGYLKQSQYMIETYGGEVWTWGEQNDLVKGFIDYDLVAVFGPEATDGLIVFWTKMQVSEYSIKWDKEGLTLNLQDYLARGREISLRRSIDASPNELKFTISHGHLFDPDNLLSLLSPILQKGRKITVRMGEQVGGSDYWVEQGTFTLTEIKLKYGRGQYPEMEVRCLDRRFTWDHAQVLATEYYSLTDPLTLLTDILTDLLGFESAEVDLPVFDTAVPISHQWIDSLPKDIIGQICNRFGYYPRITNDNKFSARKISDANAVDHVYVDNTKLIGFTPDDSFSDFTNRIIVVGQESTEVEIVFGEERIETISGTIGWWKREKDYTIYFSKDMSRRCRNPRLLVLESSSSAPFQLAGKVSESISYIDPDEYYCIVTIEGPDLMPLLAAAIASVIAAYFVGDLVTSIGWGWTTPVGRYIQMVGVILAIQILASVCNFQFEIWARPLGKVRRSLQGEWNDADLQAKIEAIVSRKIEEPLCTSVPECTQVAAQEGLVVQLQRRRRNFEKVAHLQDEEGDTLQIPHPYTGVALKIFVTELTRKMLIPELQGEEGYFIDEIESWRL